MDLKKIFSANKKREDLKTYLAIEIHESLIKSATWKIDSEQSPEVISLGSFEMWDSQESLLNGIDASLTSAVKDLSVQPNEVIFGLPESWLKNNKIHPSKIDLVKQIIKELNLKPLGMVTVTQAIVHYLKKIEGVPPTAILLEIYSTKVIVTVIKLGQVQDSEEVGRSGDLAKDVEEALVRVSTDQLPPRFLLTNGSNLENEQQQLLSHSWQDKISFLHLPKVEVLPIDFSIKAVALAGGVEAVKSLGVNVNDSLEKEVKKTTLIESSSSLKTHNLKEIGFDVEESLDTQATSLISQKNLIAENVDISTEKLSPSVSAISPTKEISSTEFPSSKTNLTQILSQTTDRCKNFFTSIPIFKRWFIYPLLILIIILTTTTYYLLFSKAKIILTLPSQSIEETQNITFSASPQEGTIPIEIKTVSSQTTQSISTTGEATIGDRATGKITIYNRTLEPITLNANTKIISNIDGLVYTLDTEVVVASKSSDLISGEEKFGKSTGVTISANRIGVDYNLAQESNFAVDKYSKTILYAIGETDFSGGSSRVVKAVSQDDKDFLLSSATKEIEKSLQAQISQQNTDLFPIILGEIKFDQQIFDKEVGEEADSVELELSASTQVIIYSKSKLIEHINQGINNTFADSYVLAPEKTNFDFTSPEFISKNTYKIQVKINGVLIPYTEEETLIGQVVATSINKAQEKLKQSTDFESAIILIKPKIPLLSRFLPIKQSNISLEIIIPDQNK